jgi:PPOX class probable FMN-dependent enzyme
MLVKRSIYIVDMIIKSIEELRKLYSKPSERAVLKELSELEGHSINFIDKSPFVLVGTHSNKGEADVSPKGGKPGFIKVLNKTHIAIPDSKGNNRLDSLTNIIESGKIGLLFLIPGIDETLRVNGTAYLSTSPEHLDLFIDERNQPKVAIVVKINKLYMHCAKALMRSKLWSEEIKLNRSGFPSMGQILKDQMGVETPIESQEDMTNRYLPDL